MMSICKRERVIEGASLRGFMSIMCHDHDGTIQRLSGETLDSIKHTRSVVDL